MTDKIKKVLKWKLKFIVSLALVISGFVSVYHLAYYEKIYPKVMVTGVDISNLSILEAEKQLKLIIPSLPSKIKLEFGLNEYELETSKLGVIYDPRKTAETAFLMGRGNGFWRDMTIKWREWFEATKLDFEVNLNEEELKKQIAEISLGIDEESIQPTIQFDGTNLKLIPGKNGRLVDREKLELLIKTEIKQLSGEKILIPIELFKVKASGDDFEIALEKAEKLKRKKLEIKYEYQNTTLQGEEFLGLIGFGEDWSQAKIEELLDRLSEQTNREPQNAVFQFNGMKVIEFKPALDGIEVDKEKTKDEIIRGLDSLLKEETGEIVVDLIVNKRVPEIKIDEVNDLGIKELIGEGRSSFFHSIPTREHNVVLTASRINGALVSPGEVFSFNTTVGDISAATGFQAAYIIKDGKTILGDGGGVCQGSTTVFRAALDAGLEIVERHPHAYRVNYYEQGSSPGIDATVYSPNVDLRFRNDTSNHILIQTEVNLDTKQMRVGIYGTSDGRKAVVSNIKLWNQSPPPEPLYEDDLSLPSGVVKQIDWAAWGASASFDWEVTRQGEMLHQKTFYSNYRPWRAVYLRGVL